MAFFDIFKSNHRIEVTEIMKRQCLAFIENIYNSVLPEAMLSNKNIKCIEIIFLGMFIVIASYIMAHGMTEEVVKQINFFKNAMEDIIYKYYKKYSPEEVYSTALLNDLAEARLREYMAIHAAYVKQGIFLFMATINLLNYVFVNSIDLDKKNKFARLTIDQTIKHWTDNSREFYYNKS